MLSKARIAMLAFVGASAMSISAAMATETGVTSCLHMQKQVSQALDAHQQSPNYGDAHDMQRAGNEFCQAGLFDQGLHRYARALDLLGVKSADLGRNPS